MSIGADWPLSIMATQDVACGARLWSTGNQLRATLILKATFTLVPGGPMRLVSPATLATVDEFAASDPQRSIVVPSDLVPYRPRGEIIFVGHAHAPNGNPCASLTARIAVIGHRTMVDKSIHVFGERVLLDETQTSQPVPFTRMPVVYERATQSAEENPIGMTREAGAPAPNLLDPADATSPAGFGAIPPHWPARRRMLRALDPAVVEAAVPDIPDAFAWSYFQAAPPDQRCGFFEGNEWIVLDGLNPDHPHLQSQLPGARAAARLYTSSAMTTYREFPLVADTLFVDGDRGLVCLVWRGNLDVDAATVGQLQALAGLELPGRAIPWPETSVAQVIAPPMPSQQPAADHGQARAQSSAAIPAAQLPARSQSTSGMPAVQPATSGQSSSGIPAVQPARAQSSSGIPAVQEPARAQSTPGMPAVHAVPGPNPPTPLPASGSGHPPPVAPPYPVAQTIASPSALPRVSDVQDAPRSPAHSMPAPVVSDEGPRTAAYVAPPQGHGAPSPEIDPGVMPAGMPPQPAAPLPQAHAAATLIGSNAQVMAAAAQALFVPVLDAPAMAPPEASPPAPSMTPASAPIPLAAKTTEEAINQMSVTGGTTITVAHDVIRAQLRAAFDGAEPAQPTNVQPEWLEPSSDQEEQNTRIVSQTALGALLASPASEGGVPTVPHPGMEGARLMGSPDSLNPTTMKRPKFDDPETFQPDSASIARIVQEAEAELQRSPERRPTDSPPTMMAQGIAAIQGAPYPPSPLSQVPTPSPMAGVQNATEAERVAWAARARAEAAAAEGAALAREHIAAGGMRKARPPKTTIRGLADPARVAESSVHEEETNRPVDPVDPSTQRFDHASTTRPGGERLAELMQKANRGDFPPLDEPAPTRQFEASQLAAALGALEPQSPEPGASHTAISPAFPVRSVPEPGSSRRRPLSSRPDRPTTTGMHEPLNLLREEVVRRIAASESLAAMALEGADLSNLDLTGQNLSGARLRGTGFRNTKLVGADLSQAILDEADLTHAQLDNANLSRASLRSAILNDASLRGANASEANFEAAIGTSAAAEGLAAEGALFVGARFDCARFDEAKLQNADFTEAIIDGASFEGANLTDARLYEARGEAASFVRAILTGARLDASVLVRGRFQNASAADSLWDSAELDQATFEGARLAGASFTKTSCRETIFSSADLSEARFNRSVLWGARFQNVDMGSANFEGADLRGAVFSQGSMPPGGSSVSSPPGATGQPPGA